jgi:hypothetical protein
MIHATTRWVEIEKTDAMDILLLFELSKPLTIANSYIYSWELYVDVENKKGLYPKFDMINVKILQEK